MYKQKSASLRGNFHAQSYIILFIYKVYMSYNLCVVPLFLRFFIKTLKKKKKCLLKMRVCF